MNTWPLPFPVLLIEPQAFRQVRQMIYHWVACPRILTKFVCVVHVCTHVCEGQRTPLDTVPSTLSSFLRQSLSLDWTSTSRVGCLASGLQISSCLCYPVLVTSIQQGAWSFRGFLPDTLQSRKLRSHSSHSMCTVGFSSGTCRCILEFTLVQALFISPALLEQELDMPSHEYHVEAVIVLGTGMEF